LPALIRPKKNGVDATDRTSEEKPSTSAAAATIGKVTVIGRGTDNGRAGTSLRRARYEIVNTRPKDIIRKSGSEGNPIRLQCNYFRVLTTPKWHIYQYYVEFKPEIEVKGFMRALLYQHCNLFGGFLFDGKILFCTKTLPDTNTVLSCKAKTGEEYTATVKFIGTVQMDEYQSLQVLNLIMRRSMEGLQLQLVGRNFYDPKAMVRRRHSYSLHLKLFQSKL